LVLKQAKFTEAVPKTEVLEQPHFISMSGKAARHNFRQFQAALHITWM
jgi:hypothetical protein